MKDLIMETYIIRQIEAFEYSIVRKLDREAFAKNERNSDGELHEIFADNVRKSPFFIKELDLVAIFSNDNIIGHGIFSKLPMGDNGNNIIWLNSLAVKHGLKDNHSEKKYEFQRKGIGTAIVQYGLKIAKSLGYSGCMTCGHPDVYRKKMSFKNYLELGIKKDSSVDDPDGAIHAIEFVPNAFDETNKILSFLHYNFVTGKIEK